jgi:hypothetical protein
MRYVWAGALSKACIDRTDRVRVPSIPPKTVAFPGLTARPRVELRLSSRLDLLDSCLDGPRPRRGLGGAEWPLRSHVRLGADAREYQHPVPGPCGVAARRTGF